MTQSMEELIERLREAKGPDRELDAFIGWTVDGWNTSITPTPEILWYAVEQTGLAVSEYTASIDAALALMERCLPPKSRALHLTELVAPSGDRRTTATILVGSHQPDSVSGSAATPPLAILLALLTALNSKASP